jgi:heme exporter protein D
VNRTRRPDPLPLETDDVKIIAIGTGLWFLALVATLVAHDRLADDGHESWVWVALAGTFVGLLGLRYVVRRRSALRREAADEAPREPLT